MVDLDRLLLMVVALLAGAFGAALWITQASATTEGLDREAALYMTDLVNEFRAQHDLPRLTAADDITQVAEQWSIAMADAKSLEHNPEYGEQLCCWELVTENVAWAEGHRWWMPGDPVRSMTEELHQGLLNSPSHRENILHPTVDQIGIGVHVDADGDVWITQNFRRYRP